MGIYRGAYAPGEKGKRLEVVPLALWGYSVPIQSKSNAITPAPSGYIPPP